MKIVDAATVTRVLTMGRCIDLMAHTQQALSRGDVRIPLRTALPVAGGRGSLLMMPGESGPVFGAKLLSVFPGNAERPVIQGWILLFDPDDGAPLALVDAASVTAIRTAAASGAATRVLANEEVETLVLLGYGVQAATHLEAMLAVRPFHRVLVWGRDPRKAQAFARTHAGAGGATVEAVAGAAAAVRQGDVICAVSGAREPLIRGADLKPGAHLNLVGAHSPDAREADSETLARARIFTEITTFALEEAGDLLLAIRDDAISAEHIRGEIGDVLSGNVSGRTDRNQITLYKSLGNVAQDLAAASYVIRHC